MLIDVSVPIRHGMFVYTGNPEVRLERALAIEQGDQVNVSRLTLGVHSGTHIDAPLHFIEDGAGAEAHDLEQLIGPAAVVDATRVEGAIDGRVLSSLEIPSGATRVLFKTRNSELWERDTFTGSFIRLTGEGADALVAAGVQVVGIDYLSIVGSDGAPARVLLATS